MYFDPRALVGTVLDGTWKLDDLVGSGAMGCVYRARDLELDRLVAVKVMTPAAASDPLALQRFEREARVLAQFDHPNIVSIHAVSRHQGMPFLVMRHVSGDNLELLRTKRGGKLPVNEAVRIICELCLGLAHLHVHGIVHRDIKPANIIVGRDGHVTLLDFGIARPVLESNITRTGVTSGTPAYMAPEQVSGVGTDGRADLYAAACILFELLSGQTPFTDGSAFHVMKAHLEQAPPDLLTLQPSLKPELGALVARALAKQPSDRFATAAEFRDALMSTLPEIAGFDMETARMTTAELSLKEFQRQTRRKNALSVAAVVGGVLTVAALVVLSQRDPPAPPPPPATAPMPVPIPAAAQEAPAPKPQVPPAPATLEPPDVDFAPMPDAVPKPAPKPAPALAPAVPKMATVSIVSELDGKKGWAYVELDGVRLQRQTPMQLSVKPGAHKIRLLREGYKSVEATFTVGAGAKETLTYELLK